VKEAIQEAPFSIKFFSPYWGVIASDGKVTSVKPPPPPPKKKKNKKKDEKKKQSQTSSSGNHFFEEEEEFNQQKKQEAAAAASGEEVEDEEEEEEEVEDERFMPKPYVEVQRKLVTMRKSDIFYHDPTSSSVTGLSNHGDPTFNVNGVATVKSIYIDVWTPPKNVPRLGVIVFLLPVSKWLPGQYLQDKFASPRLHAAVTSIYTLATQVRRDDTCQRIKKRG
jgi:hypothetical protein